MRRIKILSADAVKLIAVTAMTLDHIAWLVFPGRSANPVAVVLHIIGRIACPVMCYFVAEGYYHTRNINRYTLRLLVFAFISHFAFVFSSDSFSGWTSFIPFYNGSFLSQTSVMWPLLLGLVNLRAANDKRLGTAAKAVIILLSCLAALPGDWNCVASLAVLAAGLYRGCFKKQAVAMFSIFAAFSVIFFFEFNKLYGVIQGAAVLALPILMMYNGSKSKRAALNKIMKWGFYIYYPLHLTIIGFLKHWA